MVVRLVIPNPVGPQVLVQLEPMPLVRFRCLARLGAFVSVDPIPADIKSEVVRQRSEHAANSVAVIVMLTTRVIDGILATAMCLPFQQSQLFQEPHMIGQPHQTACE